jgi:hypothetical protein
LQYFQRALDRYLEAGDNGGIGDAYNNLTSLMFARDDLTSAMQYFQEGAKIWQIQGNKYQVARYFKIMVFIRLMSVFTDSPEVTNARLPSIIKLWSYAENREPEFDPPITVEQFMNWWDTTAAQAQMIRGNLLDVGEVQTNRKKLQTALETLGSTAFSQALTEGEFLSFNQALGSLSERS